MQRMKAAISSGLMLTMCIALAMATGCARRADDGGAGTTGARAAEAAKNLTIWWAQWAPADGLQELADTFGRKEQVTVKVHQIPWSNFQDQVFQEFGRQQTAFDIVVGDSQWLGR